jgi:hypothetical protein
MLDSMEKAMVCPNQKEVLMRMNFNWITMLEVEIGESRMGR